jgi:hypothetical protein
MPGQSQRVARVSADDAATVATEKMKQRAELSKKRLEAALAHFVVETGVEMSAESRSAFMTLSTDEKKRHAAAASTRPKRKDDKPAKSCAVQKRTSKTMPLAAKYSWAGNSANPTTPQEFAALSKQLANVRKDIGNFSARGDPRLAEAKEIYDNMHLKMRASCREHMPGIIQEARTSTEASCDAIAKRLRRVADDVERLGKRGVGQDLLAGLLEGLGGQEGDP